MNSLRRAQKKYRLLCQWQAFLPVYVNAASLADAIEQATKAYAGMAVRFPLPANHKPDDAEFEVQRYTPLEVRRGRYALVAVWRQFSIARVEARNLVSALSKLDRDRRLPPIDVTVDADLSPASFLALQCDPIASRELAEEDYGRLEPLGPYEGWPERWPGVRSDARPKRMYCVAG
jgi:hypothetical protein